MDSLIVYISIVVILVIAELVYFRIADKCNIIDKPNERSSHKTIVLRGGGIIFTIGLWIWSIVFGFQYPWLLAGVTLLVRGSWLKIHDEMDIPQRLQEFIESEGKSCSMDIGGITPEYVYRMSAFRGDREGDERG